MRRRKGGEGEGEEELKYFVLKHYGSESSRL